LNDFSNATFIACLSFGYTCSRFWGKLKPNKELGTIFWALQPFFFGTAGASILFSQISARDVGSSLGVLIIGMTLRLVTVFLCTYGGKFTIKEKILMTLSWGTKGTITAAYGTVIAINLK